MFVILMLITVLAAVILLVVLVSNLTKIIDALGENCLFFIASHNLQTLELCQNLVNTKG